MKAVNYIGAATAAAAAISKDDIIFIISIIIVIMQMVTAYLGNKKDAKEKEGEGS